MASTFMNDPTLVGPVTGLVTAINAITEMLIAAKSIEPATLAAILEAKIEEFRQVENTTLHDAANVHFDSRATCGPEQGGSAPIYRQPPQGKAENGNAHELLNIIDTELSIHETRPCER